MSSCEITGTRCAKLQLCSTGLFVRAIDVFKKAIMMDKKGVAII
jgi:hypothetical protein